MVNHVLCYPFIRLEIPQLCQTGGRSCVWVEMQCAVPCTNKRFLRKYKSICVTIMTLCLECVVFWFIAPTNGCTPSYEKYWILPGENQTLNDFTVWNYKTNLNNTWNCIPHWPNQLIKIICQFTELNSFCNHLN